MATNEKTTTKRAGGPDANKGPKNSTSVKGSEDAPLDSAMGQQSPIPAPAENSGVGPFTDKAPPVEERHVINPDRNAPNAITNPTGEGGGRDTFDLTRKAQMLNVGEGDQPYTTFSRPFGSEPMENDPETGEVSRQFKRLSSEEEEEDKALQDEAREDRMARKADFQRGIAERDRSLAGVVTRATSEPEKRSRKSDE